MDAIAIRPAAERDCGPIASLSNHYIRNSVIHFGTEDVTAEEIRGQWEKGRGVYPWLVAYAGGSFAGFAKAGVWRERAAYRWTVEAGIYIALEHQGRGLGRRLYAALIDELRARGFHSVIGGITLPNGPSERLHDSLGFAKVSHVRHAGWKFGAWHDVGFWQLMLRGDEHEPTEAGAR